MAAGHDPHRYPVPEKLFAAWIPAALRHLGSAVPDAMAMSTSWSVGAGSSLFTIATPPRRGGRALHLGLNPVGPQSLKLIRGDLMAVEPARKILGSMACQPIFGQGRLKLNSSSFSGADPDPAEHSADVMRHRHQPSADRSETVAAQQVESQCPQQSQHLHPIALGV